jgi:hypothetical protein
LALAPQAVCAAAAAAAAGSYAADAPDSNGAELLPGDELANRALAVWPARYGELDQSALGKLGTLVSAPAYAAPAPLVIKKSYTPPAGPKFVCPDQFQGVFADMGDGDMKEVTISGDSMTIKPSGNDQKWVVNTKFNPQTCTAPAVDFKVPGKPGYPPVPVSASVWSSAPDTGSKTASEKLEVEFLDPSGTLGKKDRPLNRWVQLGASGETEIDSCPKKLEGAFLDMKDKDVKKVFIDDKSMQIQAYDNTWLAKGTIDSKSCSATIDFNVPGKKDPPPIKVKVALLSTKTVKNFLSDFQVSKDGKTEKASVPSIRTSNKYELEFTDPSGKVADKDFPLNHWVEVFLDPSIPGVTGDMPGMEGMDMSKMSMGKMDMKGMDMKGMDMKGMDMKGMDMKGMDMKGMDMKGMDMKGMDMK